MEQSSLWTTYPGKALYTLFAILLNSVRFPLWILWYIPRSNRPHKDWSLAQAIRVNIVYRFLETTSTIEMKTPLSLLPGAEKDRFVVVNPAKEAYYVDMLSADSQVRPTKTGITWYPRRPNFKTEKAGLVSLHFHGGAYAIGDGRTADAGFAAKTILANSDIEWVCCPQYRLSSNKGDRFPAQLQDAVTCYSYLINDLGIPPSKIIFSGDSAGANLALATIRYIEEFGKKTNLPKPALALLFSIWANPGKALGAGAAAILASPNFKSDYIPAPFGIWGAKTLNPSPTSGHDINSRYITFENQAFKTDVPLYFSGGECEVLLPDITTVAQQFKEIPGNRVQFQIEEHCVHDTILTGWIVNFQKEAAQSVKRMNVFIRDVLGNKGKL